MNEGSIALEGEPKEIFKSKYPELLGVGVPKVTKLFNMLKEEGLKIRGIPLTPDEASKIMEEILIDHR